MARFISRPFCYPLPGANKITQTADETNECADPVIQIRCFPVNKPSPQDRMHDEYSAICGVYTAEGREGLKRRKNAIDNQDKRSGDPIADWLCFSQPSAKLNTRRQFRQAPPQEIIEWKSASRALLNLHFSIIIKEECC